MKADENQVPTYCNYELYPGSQCYRPPNTDDSIEGGDLPLGASVSLFMVPILTVAAVFILRDVHRRAGEMS